MSHHVAPAAPEPAPDDGPPRREALLALAPEDRAPRMERYLRGVVASALQVAPARLDPGQPLAALGLDSLAAIELQHTVESELGLVVALDHLLDGRSLAQLAVALLDALVAAPAATATWTPPEPARAADAPVRYPLSHGQCALWFLQQLAPESAAYHLASAARIRGELDTGALRDAFQALVDRHAALRTTFPAPEGEPIQLVHPHMALDFVEWDAAKWDAGALDARLVAEIQRPFDLAEGPLLRVHMFRRAAREHALLLVAHHLVADLWSLSVLMHELDALYPAARAGRPLVLAPSPSYAEYAARQAAALDGAEGERLWAYWQAQLADVDGAAGGHMRPEGGHAGSPMAGGHMGPPMAGGHAGPPLLDLPTDRPRPAVQTYRGAAHVFKLAPDLAARLKALAQASDATLYMTLLAAFQALLYRYSGQRDVVVGSPTAGRSRSEAANLVGYLVNPVVLRAKVDPDMAFGALLSQARASALAAFAHQEYPFALLVERLQPERDPSRSPLFQVMFALQKSHLLDEAGLSAFALGLDGTLMHIGGLELEAVALTQQPAPFDLALLLAEVDSGLAGALQYNTDLFDMTTIRRMAGHLRTLLESLAADPARTIGQLPLLDVAERHQLLVEWNDTATGVRDRGSGVGDTATDADIALLFAAQAEYTPDVIAVVFDGRWTNDQRPTTNDVEESLVVGRWSSVVQLTYAELNRRANQLAHHLRGLGAGPETMVGVCMERSPESVIALLGILKAGAVYLPLDPAYPSDRVSFMLADSRASILMMNDERPTTNDEELAFVLRPSSFVNLSADWPMIARQPATNPPTLATSDNLAYVIYTSGSTGVPKGALVERRGLARTLLAAQRQFGFRPGDVMPWIASPAFDIVLFECLSPLLAGGTTLVLTRQDTLDPSRLLAHLERATVFHTLPSLMAQIVQAIKERAARRRYAHVRLVFVGGDAVPPELLAGLRDVFPRAGIHVLYGPTEATIIATQYSVPCAGQVGRRLIGRPLPNARIYLLDARGQPAPIGIAGELFIGGASVARGYLNRPELTAERFVPNPFARVSGIGSQVSEDSAPNTRYLIPDTRLYKTGDLARFRPDGTLEFLGRIDGQVKLRGYRIELGEVEAALRSHPDVRAAAVLMREDAPGDPRLVAYIVPAETTNDQRPTTNDDRPSTIDDGTSLESSSIVRRPWSSNEGSNSSFVIRHSSFTIELRAFLKQTLPAYMIPGAFVLLDALPLTPRGKLDRRALPAPDRAQPEPRRAAPAPRTAVERMIAECWRAVLRVEQVGLDDNFFDLGGHSLLVVQVQRRLRETLGREIPIVTLFTYPTVRALAEHIDQGQPDDRPEPITAGAARRRRRAPRHEEGAQPLDIAIIGMAGRFPGALTIEDFWRNLRDGVESIAFFSDEELVAAGVAPAALADPRYVKARAVLDDVEQFDAAFFGMPPREAASLDPQQRVFLECAHEALEQAGYAPESFPGAIGVYAGASMNSYLALQLAARPALVDTLGAFQLMLLNDKDHLTTRVAYKLNLSGPGITVQTACSTSLVAVHLACRSLLSGECDMALAGGVSVRLPQHEGYYYQEGGILSPDGHCRAFDAAAQGTVSGAGAGVVLLKPLADALADGDQVYAVIKGSAVNNDGALKVGYTAPSVERQAAVIAEALAVAGADPATVGYIEAHGTGTPLGDPIELAALARVFGGQPPGSCAIGSLKPNIGHLDAAAGVAGLIKATLALHHGRIPPSLNFSVPNPQIDFEHGPFAVNTSLRDWPAGDGARRAGVSSFGMGGTNAHVVLEEAPPREPLGPSRPWQLLLLSARSAGALDAATANLAAHLRQNPDLNLADVAYTLKIGRRMFGERRMLVCRDREDAIAALEARDPARLLARGGVQRDRPVVFLFPGQGAQHTGMARELYQVERGFRAVVDRCCELLAPDLGVELREIIFDEGRRTKDEGAPTIDDRRWTIDEMHSSSIVHRPSSESGELLNQTQYAQPALFVVEYALARLWMSWGIRPQAMIGHSLGEYVAACLAGVFSLEDALRLVAARGRLMQQLPEGAMLSVALSERELKPLLGADLALAAVNAPSLCVVSGPPQAVAALHERLRTEQVECRPLHTSHAFHSAMMDPILAPFAELVGRVALKAPAIPYISNVTGDWITTEQATDPNYWARHLRATVRFAEGMRALLAEPDAILLEVGPGQTLGTLARQQEAESPAPLALASLPHPRERQPKAAFVLGALGRLWLAGARVDWAGFYADERRSRVALPTYPFERQRYWVDSPERAPAGAAEPDTAGRKRPIAEWFYVPVWRQALPPRPFDPRQLPEGRSRWLVFADGLGIGARLAERLARVGQQVVVVEAGTRFARRDASGYTIDPRSAGDYDALLAELRALDGLPAQIVHAWSVRSIDATEDAERFELAQQAGCYSLLLLAQSLARQHATDPLRIWVVASRLHAIESGDTVLPEQATLLGPCRVIPQEYPQIACRCVEIVPPAPGSRAEEQLVEQLLAELGAPAAEALVAYRGRQRWVQRYEALRLEEAPALPREGGAYIVVGGAGGAGLALARELGRTAGAKLALIGLAELPPDLAALGRDGAALLAIGADVADAEQMRAAVERARARFGAIHGVVYAADESDAPAFRTIAESDPDKLRRQFEQRALGLYALERALADQPLDFCVLAASLSSALGGLGLCAYTAANLFMDAFAQRHNRSHAVPWISVDWDVWQTGAGAEARAALGPGVSELFITPEEGAESFRRILAGAAGLAPQIVISTSDLQARLDQWVGCAARERAPARRPAATDVHARPGLENAYVAPEGEAEQRIAEIWQELLDIAPIGVHDNFFALGGHSLLGTQLIARLREVFEVDVSLRALFEAPTVAEMALLIEGLLIEQLEALSDGEDLALSD